MTEVNQAGIDLIKRFEGCRLEAYRCPAGVPTIGYGHTSPGTVMGQKITQDQAEAILKDDLRHAAEGVMRCLTRDPTPNQLAAMVSLVFNIGGHAFESSSVCRAFNQGDMARAAAAFMLWDKITVNGVKTPSQGLARRRKAEADLFLTP